MATKRTGHTGSPCPPGGYPGQIERRNVNAVARLLRYAADMDLTPTAFLRRYGTASTNPPARPHRNGKALDLD